MGCRTKPVTAKPPGCRAITKAAWCAVAMFGLDRKRFSEIVVGFYQRFGGEPKGDLYWRLP